MSVRVSGASVRLTKREFELLRFLVENRNRVLSRDRLLERVWGFDRQVETRSVDVHVGRLRGKLGHAGRQIETVIGMGYRFVEEHAGRLRDWKIGRLRPMYNLPSAISLPISQCMLLSMNDVLAIVLGGGQGSRLFPLTHQRSKPAVPIGGKYRLIDVPISNCLHADLRRIFVLTQFNSASLNHHVAQTYRMDPFSHGFVDIIAAEQTPDSSSWFQGTADAVRQAARHFRRHRRPTTT